MVVHWRSRLFTQFTGAVLAGSHLIVTIIAIYMEQNIEIQTIIRKSKCSRVSK